MATSHINFYTFFFLLSGGAVYGLVLVSSDFHLSGSGSRHLQTLLWSTPTPSYVCCISVQQYVSFDRVVPCLKRRDKTISASEAFLARALARKKYKLENLPESKGSRREKLFRACLNMLLRNLFKDFPGFSSDTAVSLDTCHIDTSMPAVTETRGTQVQSLGQEDPLEWEMATHSSIPAWRIPWTEEPGGLHHGVAKNWTGLSNWAGVHTCSPVLKTLPCLSCSFRGVAKTLRRLSAGSFSLHPWALASTHRASVSEMLTLHVVT